MYETDNFPIFTATDSDGDKLQVEGYGPGLLAFVVAGEDGHRTAILTLEDAARLAEVIRQQIIAHGTTETK